MRQALDEHGLLLFRGQSDLKPEHHVALSSWFGTVFPLPPRFQHPRAPHADVLRVSNAEAEGLVGVGTTGWHMDVRVRVKARVRERAGARVRVRVRVRDRVRVT